MLGHPAVLVQEEFVHGWTSDRQLHDWSHSSACRLTLSHCAAPIRTAISIGCKGWASHLSITYNTSPPEGASQICAA